LVILCRGLDLVVGFGSGVQCGNGWEIDGFVCGLQDVDGWIPVQSSRFEYWAALYLIACFLLTLPLRLYA
jgi:hypothetical protein